MGDFHRLPKSLTLPFLHFLHIPHPSMAPPAYGTLLVHLYYVYDLTTTTPAAFLSPHSYSSSSTHSCTLLPAYSTLYHLPLHTYLSISASPVPHSSTCAFPALTPLSLLSPLPLPFPSDLLASLSPSSFVSEPSRPSCSMFSIVSYRCPCRPLP